jgi:hypothetical protein
MIKLDSSPTRLTYVAPSNMDVASVRRFIVLVPCLEVDLTPVTHRVWELAKAPGAHVKLLGLCNDETQEPSLRRRLVTMCAIVNYGNVSAEAEVTFGNDWVDAVKSRRQAGDMVVCFAEQRAGLLQRPLSQILQSDLDIPLYILSGLYPPKDSSSRWLVRAAAWIGSIAIIAGFFVLQTRISLLTDWSQTILMLLSTAVEVWAIWIWNSLLE